MSASYDLAVNLPLRRAVAADLGRALAVFPVSESLLGYPPAAGDPGVRDAVSGWMRRHTGFTAVDPSRLIVTLGARHALSLALDESCGPGETLLVEAPTYQGFRATVEARGVRVRGVAMDTQGMLPDALDDMAAATGARTVYLQPTLQNPTTATMPLSRRRELLAVATVRDLTIIEGDVYSPLAREGDGDPLPALADLAPERCLHAGGVGKILGPGLRVGWLLMPDAASHDRAATAVRLQTDGLPALLPSIVAGWMADGTADRHLETLQAALATRHHLARDIRGHDLVGRTGLHVWLPTGDAEGIAERALDRGVHLTIPRTSLAEGGATSGVRLSLGAEEDESRLETALRIVASCR